MRKILSIPNKDIPQVKGETEVYVEN